MNDKPQTRQAVTKFGCLTLCGATFEECMGVEEVRPFAFEATGGAVLSFERGGAARHGRGWKA
jgi:hypothetical protein